MSGFVRRGRVTVDDFNASFRGEVYGDFTVDTDWFADHVGRHGVDLARSPRWEVGGALGGMALLAFRGERAWVGGFGVVPALRGRGYGRCFLADALALARAAGATVVELEVLDHNPAALALYQHGGFEPAGALAAWKRARPQAQAGGEHGPDDTVTVLDVKAEARALAADPAAIARLARTPPACWQREPAGVAAAAPFATVLVGPPGAPAAYAFVGRAGARTIVLDAGAKEPAAGAALLVALDERFPAGELLLLNEPPEGPLHEALVGHPGWREVARQRRLVARLG